MRAAFYQGARTFTTGEMQTPTPGRDEALLRVRRVGICGTDLHIFQGAVPVAPLVSRRIPLESLQRGMEEALGGGPVMKVLVEV
jgi:threonine dehydrogenase-like Zn-dependent dehydrogenase